MTAIELWTALHGMVLGAVFLLAFAGALRDSTASGASG